TPEPIAASEQDSAPPASPTAGAASVTETAAPIVPTSVEMAKEKIEFAEVAIPLPKPTVKKIAVKTSDIGSKLDSLRDLYTAKMETKPKKAEKFDALSMIFGTEAREKTVTKKLKIRLEPNEVEAVKNLA